MGMAQASEQTFYQRIQGYRIIKMVKYFTQKGEAFHQNGTDWQLLKTFYPQNGDFLFSVENSVS